VDDKRNIWREFGGFFIAATVALVWSIGNIVNVIRDVAPRLRTGDYPYVAGAISGHVIVVAVIVFAIFYILLLRKTGFGWCLAYFFGLFGILLLVNGTLVGVAKTIGDRHDAQYALALTEMRNMRLGAATPSDSLAKTPLTATGDAGIVEGITKLELVKLAKAREAYQAGITGLDLANTLSPQQLSTDGGIAEAKARIRRARAYNEGYRREIESIVAATRQMLSNARINPSDKQQTLRGFDIATAKNSVAFQQVWDCENKVLTASDGLVQLLAHPNGTWHVKGKIVQFTDRDDLHAYRTQQQMIWQSVQDERAAIARLQSDRR